MAIHKYNYFDALVQLTGYACEAAVYLDNVVKSFDPSKLMTNIDEMHQIEHKADEKRHELMTQLAKEFLPPIEREDIVELASEIDDITDCIDDIMLHLYIYNVSELLPECREFSELVVQCCESIQKVAQDFVHFRRSSTIHEHIIHTNSLESQGDRLYSVAMRKVFTSDMTDKQVFTWARIITSLEDCCDHCEDASDLFEIAIMKNS